MKIGKISNYPWYQELVAVASLLYIAYLTSSYWHQLPNPMVSKFDTSGGSAGALSPSINLAIILGIFVTLWAVDAYSRYQLLLAEGGSKRFNWTQFFIVDGMIIMAWAWHMLIFNNIYGGFTVNWYLEELFMAIGLGLAYLLLTEMLRQPAILVGRQLRESNIHIPNPRQLPDKFFLQITERPGTWLAFNLCGVIVCILASAVLFYASAFMPWLVFIAIITFLAAILLLAFALGFKYLITPAGVDIRLVFLNIGLKFIPKHKIIGAETTNYNAMADFGGWGIRGNSTTLAYVLGRQFGLLIKTSDTNILLSTDNPQLLAGLINSKFGHSVPKEGSKF